MHRRPLHASLACDQCSCMEQRTRLQCLHRQVKSSCTGLPATHGITPLHQASQPRLSGAPAACRRPAACRTPRATPSRSSSPRPPAEPLPRPRPRPAPPQCCAASPPTRLPPRLGAGRGPSPRRLSRGLLCIDLGNQRVHLRVRHEAQACRGETKGKSRGILQRGLCRARCRAPAGCCTQESCCGRAGAAGRRSGPAHDSACVSGRPKHHGKCRARPAGRPERRDAGCASALRPRRGQTAPAARAGRACFPLHDGDLDALGAGLHGLHERADGQLDRRVAGRLHIVLLQELAHLAPRPAHSFRRVSRSACGAARPPESGRTGDAEPPRRPAACPAPCG